MLTGRRAGVLLHPTSLPGSFPIGDLGPAATRFLDWMAEAGLRVWQILPLGPPGPGASPYDARSGFAGNPLLISPERLVQDGLLDRPELAVGYDAESAALDFGRAASLKQGWLRASYERFRKSLLRKEIGRQFDLFVEREEPWLEDWSLFASLQNLRPDLGWTAWDEELRRRDPGTLARARQRYAEEIGFEKFVQFLFDRQWQGLRRAARQRDISLFGDLPFYTALDGADVWSHRELFQVDADGRPFKVAGVPPDYFSATGQLWGNPIYRWNRLVEEEFAWWIARLRSDLRRVDLLRLDHFRGYAGYWEIAADAESAASGAWVEGPGAAPFEKARGQLGDLPFVAEDLGLITDDVIELRDRLGLPGMHVLQFGFGEDGEQHLPEQHRENAVAYTGTHDNDTLRGWLAELDEASRRRLATRITDAEESIPNRLIDMAFESRSRLAVVPLQDLLGLGSETRMNRPGTTHGNWAFRVAGRQLTLARAVDLRRRLESSRRLD